MTIVEEHFPDIGTLYRGCRFRPLKACLEVVEILAHDAHLSANSFVALADSALACIPLDLEQVLQLGVLLLEKFKRVLSIVVSPLLLSHTVFNRPVGQVRWSACRSGSSGRV